MVKRSQVALASTPWSRQILSPQFHADTVFSQAATLPCAALTAWRALVVEGRIKASDTVLVEGTGGVSLFALQIAKAVGATVFATTSSEEKTHRLRMLGADHVVNYRTDSRWGKTMYQMCGGVDHVVNVGGGSTIAQSIDAVGYCGHIVLVGILGGRDATIVMPKLFFKHVRMTGIAVGSRLMQQDLIKAIENLSIQPIIDKSFGFEDLAEAFRYQERGLQCGKIVVEYI